MSCRTSPHDQKQAALSAAWLCVCVCACVPHPLTHRMQLTAMSERQELIAGREMLGELRETFPFVESGPALDAVAHTGQALAVLAPGANFPYTFHLLDVGEPNAFALPGGVVVMTRGLLAMLTNADELAGVLGHEIGHVAARHAAARVTWSLPAHAIAQLLRTTASVISPEWGQRLGNDIVRSLWTPYTHQQEREADRLGAVLCASAGYDPQGLAHVLERLEHLAGADHRELEQSHPSPAHRAELLRSFAVSLHRTAPVTEGLLDLSNALEGLVVGADPSRGATQGDALVLAAANAALDLPKAWLTRAGPLEAFSVAPAGRAVVKIRTMSAAQALSERTSVLEEPSCTGVVEQETVAGFARRSAVVRSDAKGRETTFVWLTRGPTVVRVHADHARDDDVSRQAVAAMVGSLHELRTEEAAGLEAVRLRFGRCDEEPSWGHCASRLGTLWSAAELAAWNGADSGAKPPAGPIKAAYREALVSP